MRTSFITLCAFAAGLTSAAPIMKRDCTAGTPCVGDITHYDGGLGACGVNVDSNSEFAVAFPVGLMGSASNDNPYCKKYVTIVGPGGTFNAPIKDKCMGCADTAIDLSNQLFAAVAPNGDGRVHGIQWWVN